MTTYPYERLHLPDGSTLAYVDQGRGTPMLMLHGYVGTAHRHLRGLIEEFKPNHRVFAPDLRGYGASQPPARDYPEDFYERDASDAAQLLDWLNCGPAVVVGYSDGGEAALFLAANRPDLVRGLIVWGAFGQIQPSAIAFVNSLIPLDGWTDEMRKWGHELVEVHGEWQWPGIITDYVDRLRQMVACGWRAGLTNAPRIRCPVLQVHGEEEQQSNSAEAVQLTAAIPDCRVRIVDGAGHPVQFDRPDELYSLIRWFVETLPA